MCKDFGLEFGKAAGEAIGTESVNKLAEVIGGVFPFFGTKRKAVTTYISEIQNSDLSPEAKMMAISSTRKTYKQLKNQHSIANIAQKAAKDGTDFSPTAKVDDEWLERFMDSAKFVSDEKMQLIWGNILAKEFEEPDSVPPRLIRILSEITPSSANVFASLCRLCVNINLIDSNGIILPGSSIPIVTAPDNEKYLLDAGINFSSLTELNILGLIQYNGIQNYLLKFDASVFPQIRITYGTQVQIVNKYPSMRFPIGYVLLTDAGEYIARISNNDPIDGYFEKVIEFLNQSNVEFIETPETQC